MGASIIRIPYHLSHLPLPGAFIPSGETEVLKWLKNQCSKWPSWDLNTYLIDLFSQLCASREHHDWVWSWVSLSFVSLAETFHGHTSQRFHL